MINIIYLYYTNYYVQNINKAIFLYTNINYWFTVKLKIQNFKLNNYIVINF